MQSLPPIPLTPALNLTSHVVLASHRHPTISPVVSTMFSWSLASGFFFFPLMIYFYLRSIGILLACMSV